MIFIDFDPTRLSGSEQQWWQQWKQEADNATQKVIQEWEQWKSSAASNAKFQHEFEEIIWGDLKKWLLKNVFYDKCAYCESRIARAPMHAEHFRPKGQIRFKVPGKKLLQKGQGLDECGNSIEHPGYFWLAYNWKNLLPSCYDCNSGSGKNDQFPVNRTHIFVHAPQPNDSFQPPHKKHQHQGIDYISYLQPEDLNRLEDPLLLHPYIDNPREHLRFGALGLVAPRNNSVKGQNSIDVYNLRGDSLIRDRDEKQHAAYMTFYLAAMQCRGSKADKDSAGMQAIINQYVNNKTEPFSAAVLDYIEEVCSVTFP